MPDKGPWLAESTVYGEVIKSWCHKRGHDCFMARVFIISRVDSGVCADKQCIELKTAHREG